MFVVAPILEEGLVGLGQVQAHAEADALLRRQPEYRPGERAPARSVLLHPIPALAVHVDRVDVPAIGVAARVEPGEAGSALLAGCSGDRLPAEAFGLAGARQLGQQLGQYVAGILGCLDRRIGAPGLVGDAPQLEFGCGVGAEPDRLDSIDPQIDALTGDSLGDNAWILAPARAGRRVAVEIGVEALVAPVGEQHDRTEGPVGDVELGLCERQSDRSVTQRLERLHFGHQLISIDLRDRHDETGVGRAVRLPRRGVGRRALIAVDPEADEGVLIGVGECGLEGLLGDIELGLLAVEGLLHRAGEIDDEDDDLVGNRIVGLRGHRGGDAADEEQHHEAGQVLGRPRGGHDITP